MFLTATVLRRRFLAGCLGHADSLLRGVRLLSQSAHKRDLRPHSLVLLHVCSWLYSVFHVVVQQHGSQQPQPLVLWPLESLGQIPFGLLMSPHWLHSVVTALMYQDNANHFVTMKFLGAGTLTCFYLKHCWHAPQMPSGAF